MKPFSHHAFQYTQIHSPRTSIPKHEHICIHVSIDPHTTYTHTACVPRRSRIATTGHTHTHTHTRTDTHRHHTTIAPQSRTPNNHEHIHCDVRVLTFESPGKGDGAGTSPAHRSVWKFRVRPMDGTTVEGTNPLAHRSGTTGTSNAREDSFSR